MMKKTILFSLLILLSVTTYAQTEDCFSKLEEAFQKRGAYAVPDNMYRDVIISFFEGENSYCYTGKVRVEKGAVSSIFISYSDDGFDLFMDSNIMNAQKKPVSITNGISDLIVTPKGEKLKIVFMEKLKPKARSYKKAVIPNDL